MDFLHAVRLLNPDFAPLFSVLKYSENSDLHAFSSRNCSFTRTVKCNFIFAFLKIILHHVMSAHPL